MKNMIKFLLLFCICLTNACNKENEKCHFSIKITNSSEKVLYLNKKFAMHDHDTLSLIGMSYFSTTSRDIHKGTRRATFANRCIEDLFLREKDTYFFSIYLFDATVVKYNVWEVVNRDYLVLKRYDFSMEELNRLDWRISYPPTEAMKDIKQWPPYGSD